MSDCLRFAHVNVFYMYHTSVYTIRFACYFACTFNIYFSHLCGAPVCDGGVVLVLCRVVLEMYCCCVPVLCEQRAYISICLGTRVEKKRENEY